MMPAATAAMMHAGISQQQVQMQSPQGMTSSSSSSLAYQLAGMKLAPQTTHHQQQHQQQQQGEYWERARMPIALAALICMAFSLPATDGLR